MDMHSSRHNPDFVDRTLARRLEIEDLLATFRRQLTLTTRTKDEAAFEDLYARLKTAGVGLGEDVAPSRPPDATAVWHDEGKRVAITAEVEKMMAEEGKQILVREQVDVDEGGPVKGITQGSSPSKGRKKKKARRA